MGWGRVCKDRPLENGGAGTSSVILGLSPPPRPVSLVGSESCSRAARGGPGCTRRPCEDWVRPGAPRDFLTPGQRPAGPWIQSSLLTLSQKQTLPVTVNQMDRDPTRPSIPRKMGGTTPRLAVPSQEGGQMDCKWTIWIHFYEEKNTKLLI